MFSVYVYVNFRFTKTASLNVKLFHNDSLKTLSFIARPCLFIPLQEKSTVTGIKLIGEILFTKKEGEEKTTCCPMDVQTPNSRYQKLDGTPLATCTSSFDDAVLGSLATLVVFKE